MRTLKAVLAALAVSTAIIAPEPSVAQYSNPVLAREFADPTVFKDPNSGFFYAYATNARGSGIQAIQVARSKDLVNWTYLGNALQDKPSWAAFAGGAPEVEYINGQYVMYYQAYVNGLPCLSIATAEASAGPDGPFVDRSTKPFICQSQASGGASVDPMVFLAPNGHWYLYWNSAGSLGFTIYGQQLTANGLAVTGNRVALLSSTEAWEKPCCDPSYKGIVEAPSMFFRRDDGKFYLFYSGNTYTTGAYAVGVARGSAPLGPFTKLGGPVLSSANGVAGPGSSGVIRDRVDSPWIYYHGWTEPNVGYANGGSRRMMLSPLRFDAQGRPTITPRLSNPTSPAPLP